MQNLSHQPAHSSHVRGQEWSWIGATWLGVTLGVAYLLTAHLSLTLLTKPDCVAVFWPAAGIASGTLIALGPKARVPVTVAVWAADFAVSLLNGRNFPASIVFAFCNAGETLLVSWLITHRFGKNFRLDSLRNVLVFFAAAGIGPAISAILATAGFVVFYNSSAPIPITWLNWFASDALGIIMVAPLVIGFGSLRRDWPGRWELMAGTLTLVALAVVSMIAFGSSTYQWWYTVLPLGLLLPVLLAAHCRPVFAAAATLIVACAVVWSATFGTGELGEIPSLPDRAFAARATLLAVATFTLILAALFAERRHSEAALRSSNDRLQLALGGAELGVWSLDTRTGHFESDTRDSQIHGRPPEARPRTLGEARSFIHPGDLSVLDAAFAASKRTGGRCKLEYRLASTVGGANIDQDRWVALEGTAVRDATGQLGQLLGVTRDITLRKHADRVLADRNLQLALAGKFALLGTYAYDVGSERYQVSPGYAAVHGLPEGTEETSRAEWRTRVHPDDLPGVEAGFHQAMVERRREYHCEYRYVLPDGKIRWIDSRNFISYDHDGSAPHLVGANIDVTQHKVTEAVLKEHKALLADALGVGKVIAFEWDAVTRQTRRSDNATSILGDDESGSTGRPNEFLRRVHPDDRETFKSYLGRLSPSNPSYVLNFRFCCPEGRQVWLEETAKGEFDTTGHLLRIKGLTRDITEQKKAELALAERNTQIELASKTVRVGSYAVDFTTGLVSLSPGSANILGLPDSTVEISRENARKLVHPQDLAQFVTARDQALLKMQREFVAQIRIIRANDGEVRWIEARCLIFYDQVGRPLRYIAVIIDTTERKLAEQALTERNAQLGLAGRAALVGSYTYDVTRGTMQISEGYAAIHGLPLGTTETTYNEWRTRAHPDDLKLAEGARAQAFANGGKEDNAEYRIVLSSGEVRWIERRGWISYDEDGRPERVVGVNIDVTGRKRAEERQRALLAELDHRVKNALATVSSVVSQTAVGSTSVANFVQALDGRLRSMATTHELLSFGQWQGVSLAELIRQELAPYATRHNTKISGPEVVLLPEAGQAIAMVLHELATNAAKYGALSTQEGMVSIQWNWRRNGHLPRLVLEWKEFGGPPVVASDRAGFGMSTIRDLIPYEFGGSVDLTFVSAGVQCRLELPANWFTLSKEGAVSDSAHAPPQTGNR
jgi:PAS domain S-box-containing protein